MYVQVKTDSEIKCEDGRKLSPVATLKHDRSGFKCQIATEHGAYVILYENPDGTFSTCPYIAVDVFSVLKTLPSPRE